MRNHTICLTCIEFFFFSCNFHFIYESEMYVAVLFSYSCYKLETWDLLGSHSFSITSHETTWNTKNMAIVQQPTTEINQHQHSCIKRTDLTKNTSSKERVKIESIKPDFLYFFVLLWFQYQQAVNCT